LIAPTTIAIAETTINVNPTIPNISAIKRLLSSSLKDAKILRQIKKKRLRLSANAREGLFFEFSLSVLQRFPYLSSLKDAKILRHKKKVRE
jgi:hypothetical protein